MPEAQRDEATPGDPTELQPALFEMARRLAAAGDAVGMLQALVETRLLDGIKRRLCRRLNPRGCDFDQPDGIDHDADLAIAYATDALFDTLSAGHPVRNIGGFLVKVARNRLADFERVRAREGCGDLREEGVGRGGSVLDELAAREEPYVDPDRRRREAFQAVRSLLPRLGHVRAQQVMEVILDGAEAGVIDLSDSVIAEALGIDVETAKKARQRAFQRLERIAREQGLADEILDRIRTEYNEPEDQP